MIDADHGGTIDLEEMSVIMSAQGFKPDEIKEAMRIGDSNGDGELDFEEFVALVGTIGAGRTTSDTTAHVAGPAGNTFPFALVANGYRIKQLVDAFDPVVREVRVPQLLPRRALLASPRSTSLASLCTLAAHLLLASRSHWCHRRAGRLS